MSEENEYLLGTDRVELERLKEQHQIWEDCNTRLLDLAGWQEGDTVMDLGAGPGFTSLALAARVGASGRVKAVDTSNRFANYLTHVAAEQGLSHIDYLVADVHDLPENQTLLDGVFARWVFCFLADPEAVIHRMAKHLKPGGRFVIMDYYNYLAAGFRPGAPILTKIFQMVHKSFGDSGGNLDICDNLPVMLTRNGFRVTQLLPIHVLGTSDSLYWQWFNSFVGSFGPKLVAGGYLTENELANLIETLRQRGELPGSIFFPPPMMGIVAEKQ